MFMNILILVRHLIPSGQTTHVVEIAKALSDRGLVTTLVTGGRSGNRRFPGPRGYLYDLEENGVRVVQARTPGELLRLTAKLRADVIHAHTPTDFQWAHVILQSEGTPYVVTCHGLGIDTDVYRDALGRASVILCAGPRIAASMKAFCHKTALFQNPIDLRRFHPEPGNGSIRIVYAGRFDSRKEKGLNALMKAVETNITGSGLGGGRLQSADPHASSAGRIEFMLAGTREIERFTGRWGKCVGWCLRMDRLMNAADIVIGTGRTIREGMAAGNACLVLGWSYDGIVTPDMVSDTDFPDFSGQRHLPRPPDVQEIYEDLRRLVDAPTYLKELQQFGRAYAELHFGIEKAVDQLISVYERAMSDTG